MNEDEKAVQEIKTFIKNTMMAKFGYFGLADGEKFIMLNSGKGNIVIKIEWQ